MGLTGFLSSESEGASGGVCFHTALGVCFHTTLMEIDTNQP